MDTRRREFLESLLTTPGPSGYEADSQRVWLDYVSEFADEVRTDDYGNAVAKVEGGDTTVALAGHGDEIGFIVRDFTDDGFVKLGRIGGSDKTVSRGQHVTIHTTDGPVSGVVGQTAIHLRDSDDDSVPEISEQHVDVGAVDGDEVESLVDRGDPVTFVQTLSELENGRLAARGMDNRIGIWAAAEGLRRAAESDADATVYAVSTVQEEVGVQGAKMVGFDLAPDVAIAADVTHATDAPGSPGKAATGVELGEGPVVARGSANHPVAVDALRETSDAEDIDIQLQATGIRTGTDADAFYTSRGGIPSVNVGLPNRYMHTPVEVIDPDDLDALADLLAGFAVRAAEQAPFSVDV
ncbi:M20/M25/M40 family metallo-hydrolase [Haloarcula marismortui]|uniref:Endoglucanase n=1 Tax=Haloarcula marismortui ATCC 33800 TaxID=662476 RepID=M0JYR2_9EURY|nr:M20/M25/M40 family metallo-hydrolase [Haloarcula sinaiiensis]EMA13618.1 endoglucanase [Haloarcula sinaiiensis ATCC 33800]QUJ73347.1 M20/M25/M40 family metallo-hydrolase [Haloarcula sinaiiensis ATCC 33800]